MMMRIPLVFCLLVSVAHAADQTILGTVLIVKNPGAAEKRTVVVKGKDPGPAALVGDPTASGATLEVSLSGGSPSTQTFTLPATLNAKSKPFWSGNASKGFTYKDPAGENGAVTRGQMKVKKGKLLATFTLSGQHAPVSLVPPNQGTDGCASLAIGGGDTYHLAFTSGTVTSKGAKLFKVSKPTVEALCSSATSTTLTTTTTIATTTTTTQPPCLLNGESYSIGPQADITACVGAILPEASTRCCVGTFSVITFGGGGDPNSCTGTCGPPIG